MIRAAIAIAIAIAIASFHLPMPASAEQPREPTPIDQSADACALWESERDFTSFFFESRLEEGKRVPMRMPSAYFCGNERRDGLTHVSQLFWVRLSDFTPLSCSPSEPSAGSDAMSFLLSDHIPQPDKLRVSLGGHRGAPVETYESAPWQYGLTRYFSYPNQRRRDVYTFDSIESPSVVLRCHPEVAGTRSSCKMLLEVENIDVTIRIARSELKNWKIIEGRARKFISCGLEKN